MNGPEQHPSTELVSPFSSTTGGVMTDEVGAITGELELLTRPTADGIQARVRYADAHDIYTITGSPTQTAETHQQAHESVLRRLTTPGTVERGNELPVDLNRP